MSPATKPTFRSDFTRAYLETEKLCFFNALLFYSSLFYMHCKNPVKSKLGKLTSSIGFSEGENPLFVFKASLAQTGALFDEFQPNLAYDGPEDTGEVCKQRLIYKQMVLVDFLQCLYPNSGDLVGGDQLTTTDETWKQPRSAETPNTSMAEDVTPVRKGSHQNRLPGLTPRLFDTSLSNRALAESLRVSNEHYNVLVRRVLRQKFRELGLYTRCFLSSDARRVLMVVKGLKETIEARAERDRFPKQLELGVVDLGSFEPLDHLNRPFRIKNSLMSQELLAKQEGTDAQTFELYLTSAREPTEELTVLGGDPNSVDKALRSLDALTDYELAKVVRLRTAEFQKRYLSFFVHGRGVGARKVLFDEPETRAQWISFVAYTAVFDYNYKITKKVRKYEQFKHYRGLVDRLVAQKSLEDVNRALKARGLMFWNWRGRLLECVWTAIGLSTSRSGYAAYRTGTALETVWRTFEINELRDRDRFSNMERIKIVNSIVSSCSRIFELQKDGRLVDLYPLHDPFVKDGTRKAPFFVDILDLKQLLSRDDPRLAEVKKTLAMFQEHAEVSDFAEQPLTEDLKIRWWTPWWLPVEAIRDYFGEKIALFFEYSMFYTKVKLPVFVIGTVVYIVQESFLKAGNALGYKIIVLTFLCLNLIWSILFVEFWKRREQSFSAMHSSREGDERKEPRPGFHGTPIRDTASNSPNILFYSSRRRFGWRVVGLIGSLTLIAISIAISIAILRWRQTIPPSDFYRNLFPILVNAIAVVVIDAIYKLVAVRLTEWENHKTLDDFESSLILKLFLFSFANTFNSYITIAFLKPYLKDFFGECVQQNGINIEGLNCFNELSYQVQFLFILQFILGLLLPFVPLVVNWVMRTLAKMARKVIRPNPWRPVDQLIEKESILRSFTFVSQLDNSLFNILALVLEFCFLTFFGITFPLVGLIAFFNGLFGLHFTKYNLLNQFRRPFPIGAKTLGVWNSLLDIIVYSSIVLNSALFSFTLKGLNPGTGTWYLDDSLATCVPLVVSFVLFKFIAEYLVGSFSSRTALLRQRHQFVADRLLFKHAAGSNALARAALPFKFPSKEAKVRFTSDEVILG